MAMRMTAGRFLACFLVCGASLTMLSAEDERAETATVTGEIEVASLDDDGHTTTVYVHESRRGDILIASEGRGRELLDRVGATVKITGQLSRMKDNVGFDYVLRVSDYVVLEAAKPEGYDSGTEGADP